MIRRTVRMMQQAGAAPIVVVTGYKSDVLRQHLDGMGLVFLNNEHYASTQMFDSFKIGLEYLLPRCERLLFSPAMCPRCRLTPCAVCWNTTRRSFGRYMAKNQGIPLCCDMTRWRKSAIIVVRMACAAHCVNWVCRGRMCRLTMKAWCWTLIRPRYNRLLLHNLRVGGGQESLRLDLQLHLCALDSVFDPFFAQLLEMVRMTGSLQMACHAVHISYSKGWKLVRRMEAALGFPLLARVVGGSAGGGSQLTAEGADLLHCYQQMEKEVLATAKESFERCMARYLQLQPAEPEEK